MTIPRFRIDRHEVTNAQFQGFVRLRPNWRKERVGGDYLRHWDGDRFPEGRSNYPVVYVTWPAALAYAEWAGKRLVTEAEWEFAARGGLENPKYPRGNAEPAPSRANYADSSTHGPVAVGSYPPNPYGVSNFAGNVWEFCLDAWHDRYSLGAPRQSEAGLLRLRSEAAERRAIRGGSFDGSPFNLRVTARDSHRGNHPVPHVGFRCALSA